MGEMADFALDCAFEDYEHYERYKNSPLWTQYDEGIIDEYGATIGEPWSVPTSSTVHYREAQRTYAKANNPTGPGLCPKCGGKTHKLSGKFGEFYGCDNFPSCKGSRNG
jgi:hypothetical protein